MKLCCKTLFILVSCTFLIKATAQPYLNNESYNYNELIAQFNTLAQSSPHAQLFEFGKTDVGLPLHVFTLGINKLSDLQNNKKPVFLINNSIHAGESCGSDASVQFAQNLLKNQHLFENVIVAIIPVYNIGGYLNRSEFNRSNQNGPKQIGFRGNYQNLDLNRDFIKADAQNTLSFYEIFHLFNPHLLLETHTTNGSEHQYTLTVISPQKEKLNTSLVKLVKNELEPAVYQNMKKQNMEVIPYVFQPFENSLNIAHFYDSPRFSTGYVNLFNTIGFVTEAHKYKPYKLRVEQTLAFMESLLLFLNTNHNKVVDAKNTAQLQTLNQSMLYLNYQLDTTAYETLNFKGYPKVVKNSLVTGKNFVDYDLLNPITQTIKYFNQYEPIDPIIIPKYYVIPQSYNQVIERLHKNNIQYQVLQTDTQITGEVYYIKSYETVKSPFEKHYLHYNTVVFKETKTLQFYQGDILIHTHQSGKRFLVETLEPQALDSYFSWNFFDNILQRKEWFSPFKFDETAQQILQNNPQLKVEYEDWKKAQEPNNLSHYQLLDYIFSHSDYREDTYKMYPVLRVF